MALFKNKNNQGELLELYDGQMALPSRKLISANVPELKYSARGKELFALSQSFYGKWLTEGEDYTLVDRAIELCREAVALGYPHAVVQMAYFYDKDYVDADRTEEFRCRVACEYYGKVVYHDGAPRSEDATVPETGWEELQKIAAKMMLDMLSRDRSAIEGNGIYSLDYNSARIREMHGILPEATHERGERDGEKLISTILLSCRHNRVRAPLFGVVKLLGAEARSAFGEESEIMGLCGDINIWLNSGGKSVRVNNTSAFTKFITELESNEIWVYYFNNNLGGHRYLTGKQRKDLSELMVKDNFARFSRLKDSAKTRRRTEYLFSDDDVYFFMGGKFTSLKSALDSLIDRVVNENGWGNL